MSSKGEKKAALKAEREAELMRDRRDNLCLPPFATLDYDDVSRRQIERSNGSSDLWTTS